MERPCNFPDKLTGKFTIFFLVVFRRFPQNKRKPQDIIKKPIAKSLSLRIWIIFSIYTVWFTDKGKITLYDSKLCIYIKKNIFFASIASSLHYEIRFQTLSITK